MAYNPWGRRPPVLPTRTRDIPLKPTENEPEREPLRLTFRKLGTVQNNRVAELCVTLIERYCTGDAEYVETKGESGEPPNAFPPLGGELVEITESMCQQAAYLTVMQLGPEADRLSPEAWIAFQVLEDPTDWLAVQQFATEVQRIGRPANPKAPDVPNDSGAAMSSSLEQPSASTSNTRKLRLASTPSSAPSTLGLPVNPAPTLKN